MTDKKLEKYLRSFDKAKGLARKLSSLFISCEVPHKVEMIEYAQEPGIAQAIIFNFYENDKEQKMVACFTREGHLRFEKWEDE